jgi:hypothetical protein
MRTTPKGFASACVLGVAVLVAAACQRAAETPPAHQPQFAPDVTIKDLMLDIVDPSADVVWLSVTTVANETGLVETRPQNDEQWTKVKQGALTLAEAANLLMIPGRRVDRRDRAAWDEHARALYDAAMATYRAAEAKDADKVFELGETIELACEGCHSTYWYPNEKIPELPQ